MKSIHSASLWSGAERIGQQVLQLVISLVMARLLTPSDYGLIGMLALFLGVAGSLSDTGLGTAIIQCREVTEAHRSSIFIVNLALGILLAALLCAISPWVASFYGKPVLMPMLMLLSLQLILGAAGGLHLSLLTKELDFKSQALVSFLATIISGGIALCMACTGFGIWALVAQRLVFSAVSTAGAWKVEKWRPRLMFVPGSLRGLWKFSSFLFASSLLNSAFDNLYAAVIGKLFNSGTLGLYTRATQLAQMPSSTLVQVVGRVTFPAFSRMQQNADLIREALRRGIRTIISVHFPLMVALSFCASSLVQVVLTDKWQGAVPYLKVLAFAGIVYPLHAIHLNVLMALGRSRLLFVLEVIKKTLLVAALLATWRFGVLAMCWGLLFLSVICLVVNTFYARRLIGYSWGQQFSDVCPILTCSLVMGAGVWGVERAGFANALWVLILQVLAGVAIYGAMVWMFRRHFFADAIRNGRVAYGLVRKGLTGAN